MIASGHGPISVLLKTIAKMATILAKRLCGLGSPQDAAEIPFQPSAGADRSRLPIIASYHAPVAGDSVS